MKARNGFVSNSSSSSFVISMDDLTIEQVCKIIKHREVGNEMSAALRSSGVSDMSVTADELECSKSNEWKITVDCDEISGSTSMDNFSMAVFLQAIGVNMRKVTFES